MNEHASDKVKPSELLSLGVNNDLWFMHSDGGHKQKLTNNPKGYAVLHAHFSHSGDKIVWSERYDENKDASIFGAWRLKLADIEIDNNGRASLQNIQNLQPGGARWYESHGFSENDSIIYFSGNLTTDHKANDIYAFNYYTNELTNLMNSSSTWEEMHNSNPIQISTYSYISSSFFDWNNKWGWATLRTELFLNENDVIKQITTYNGSKKNLSKKHYFIGDHCWSPDGKSILAVVAVTTIGNTESFILKINLHD